MTNLNTNRQHLRRPLNYITRPPVSFVGSAYVTNPMPAVSTCATLRWLVFAVFPLMRTLLLFCIQTFITFQGLIQRPLPAGPRSFGVSAKQSWFSRKQAQLCSGANVLTRITLKILKQSLFRICVPIIKIPQREDLSLKCLFLPGLV